MSQTSLFASFSDEVDYFEHFQPPRWDELDLVTEGTARSWAVFSRDNRYRYALGRVWDPESPLATFGMLNPSQAGADEDDATIRKCIGFTKRWTLGGIIVVNAGAFIATDPSELLRCEDPIGPHNARIVGWAFGRMTYRIVAWGNIAKRVKRRMLPTLLQMHSPTAYCLGKTKSGEPRHPLMLPYSTERVKFADGTPW